MRLIYADKADVENISCFYGNECRIADVQEWLDEQPTVDAHGWISVEDRLPEKGEYLVVYHPCWWDDVEYDKICVGMDTFRGKTSWAKKKFQRVTHWMPLPEPPKN